MNVPVSVPTVEIMVFRCPSVAVMVWLFMQTAMIGVALDAGKNWRDHRSHLYYRVYGFSVLWPTLLFWACCVFAISFIDSRMSKETQDVNRAMEAGDQIPHEIGCPDTPEERVKEAAMNKSILNKFVWFGVGFWIVCFKESLDKNNEISWQWVFLYWYCYFAWFGVIAAAHKNWWWSDQRNINYEEELLYLEKLSKKNPSPTSHDHDHDHDHRGETDDLYI